MPKNIKLDSDGLKFYGDAENKVTLNAPASLTSDTQVLFPTSSGTLALTSDITGGTTEQYGSAGDVQSSFMTIVNNSAFEDLTGILFSFTSGKKYKVEWGFYNYSDTVQNLKMKWLLTGSPTVGGICVVGQTGTTSAIAPNGMQGTGMTAGGVNLTDAVNGDHFNYFICHWCPDTTGTAQLQLAQQINNGNTQSIYNAFLVVTELA